MPPASDSLPIVRSAISLDSDAAVPLYRQLYDGLRSAILSGRLLPGTRLPPTRTLADALGVSRTTVVNAFDQLAMEGYFETKVGAGTFVTSDLPDNLIEVRRPPEENRSGEESGGGSHRLSTRGRELVDFDVSRFRDPTQPRPFCTGLPALDAFPIETWSRLASRRWRSLPAEQLTYGDVAGYKALREAISDYVRSARGVHCTPDQVIVVSGTTQAINLAATVLLDAGDRVGIEDPGYPGARGTIRATGATPVPLGLDEDGIDLSDPNAHDPAPHMVYVTPSHQYPLGVTMPLQRRLELLEWADENQAWILEDDYDSEYRYLGRPISALQGLDETGRVIYIGTFSKVLFPAVRLGYLVVPPTLEDAFTTARPLVDRPPPLVDQMTLADFIREGHFERHIRQMRSLYASRQSAMVEAIETNLDDHLDVRSDQTGLHLVGWLQQDVEDQTVSRRLDERGIVAPPLSSYSMRSFDRDALLLGYAAVPEEDIRDGVQTMKHVFESL